MRISKEVSGNALARDAPLQQGRGEYEWCNLESGDPTFDQLLNRRIVISLSGGLLVDTGCIFGQQGGKQRIRVDSGVRGRELYPPWHVAGLLMLPKPIRAEPSWGDGTPVMRSGQYGITHLHIRRAALHAPNHVHIEISRVDVANHYQEDSIDFDQRFAQVQQVWTNRTRFEPAIAALIETHEHLARSGVFAAAKMIDAVASLQREMSNRSADYGVVGNAPTTDVLPVLVQILSGVQQEPQLSIEAVPPEELEIRLRQTREWKQWVTARGADSAKFRQEVRRAYNSTCAVCGLRLPPIGPNGNPGVDAAHILPWATYDLDHVSNGLCLCKLHHWAFDESLIEIQFSDGVYSIVVPNEANAAIVEAGESMSLDFLKQYEGEIPNARLPQRQSDRPNPECLRRLKEILHS